MAKVLLRISKRKTAWEAETGSEETYLVEFRDRAGNPDLSPSVYELEDASGEIVQAYSEHYAGLELDPPRGSTNVDFGGEHEEVTVTPGTSSFIFTQLAHREIKFADSEALRNFVELVFNEAAARRRPTTKKEVKEYVQNRLKADDPEWIAHCETHPKWGKKPK